MNIKTVLNATLVGVFAWFVMACAVEKQSSVLFEHILEEDEDYRLCLDCHDETATHFPFRKFVHTTFFAENHRLVALQSRRVCSMCHQPSSCDECHGVGIELRPSRKDPIGVNRRLPHRGDYLSRHRIDGRMDPISCRRCHANPKTAKTCKPCHG